MLQGNGFITDPAIIAQNGFSDPNPFFQQLLTKSYLGNVVISPHWYGSSISLVSSGYSGVELYNKLSTSGGYLTKQGYCSGGTCHQFPIVVGETGSDLQDSRDLAFYESMRKYIKLEGDGDDGRHSAIPSVFWWAFNANSGDTKGVVLDDWTTINWRKVQLLEKLINLKPWYAPSGLTGGIESVGNNAIAIPDQTSFPFPAPLRGVVWDPATLLNSNTTLNGDFGVVLQRVIAYGFDTVFIPFEFNALASSQYLSGLVRACQPTTDAAARTAALPPNTNNSLLTTQTLPVVSSVTVDYAATTCNSFMSNLTRGQDRLIAMVNVILSNNLTVVLQNTNAYAAEVSPTAWLAYWVNFALALVDLDSPRLVLDPMNTTASAMQWQSQGGRPGLAELYRSLFPALDQILVETNFFVEGSQGNDFSESTNYFKNLQTLPWLNRVVAYASDDIVTTPTSDVNSSLTFLTDYGICLTADQCHKYQTAFNFPLTANISMVKNQSVFSTSSWFVTANDISSLQNYIDGYTSIGLRPWYYPRSAYQPIPGPGIPASSTVEAAVVTVSPCTVEVIISALDETSTLPATGALQVQITNGQDTTLFPPWQLELTGSSIGSLVYAFEGDSTNSNAGQISLTFNDYWTALWPRGVNSYNTTVIALLQPPFPALDIEATLNSQNCTVSVV